jgi:hypothetical protein
MEKQAKSEQSHKKTGASNVEYDLFSEIHTILKGSAALEKYIEDAREAGDREVETCFKTLHDQNKDNVVKLRELIGKHVCKTA